MTLLLILGAWFLVSIPVSLVMGRVLRARSRALPAVRGGE